MEGLFLGVDGACLEKVSQDAGELNLLAKGDGTEVMLQVIQSGRHFYIAPSDHGDTLEFFYVLDGALECDTKDGLTTLHSGDYFYAHHLSEVAYFKTKALCRILYVSTQPVFNYLSTRLQELLTIVRAVERKDVSTLDHNKRLQEYSLRIADRLRFSKERLEVLGYAALFHDVGKIHVPTEVLLKKGPLTESEVRMVRRHPTDGKQLVKGTFLRNIGEIIEQHHERLDGTGYPRGLKGDAILLEARVIAVADTYDAMTTDRPYRKGLPPAIAIRELRRYSGTLFDPLVVETLVDVMADQGVNI